MAQYNYFWDLQNSQAYTTHTVQQLDANATTGGGTFKWVPVANNASIENIPGIRIKPIANTKGYWERIIEGPWLVDWFGCVNTAGQSTLGGYGLVAGDLAARFNCVTKNVAGGTQVPSNTIALTDTYDTAAMKLAFNLMELGYITAVNFLNKTYYISNTCYLPLAYNTGIGLITSSYNILGNESRIAVHSSKNTTAFTFWETNIATQTQAVSNNIYSNYIIKNLHFIGFTTLGPATYYHKALELKATTGSKLENLRFGFFINAVILRFCRNAELNNIECEESVTGITVTTGNWSGATNSNSQSTNCTLNKCTYNYQEASYAAELKGFLFEAIEGVVINNSAIYIFNFNFAHKGITLDALNQTNIKTFKVESLNIALHYSAIQSIGINLLPYNTNIQLDNLSDNFNRCTLIKCDGTYGGPNNITVRNISMINANTQFENITTNNQWLFENCKSLNPLLASKWVGTQPVTGAWTADGPAAGSTIRLREAYPFYTR